jgi:hypothetical protein
MDRLDLAKLIQLKEGRQRNQKESFLKLSGISLELYPSVGMKRELLDSTSLLFRFIINLSMILLTQVKEDL